MGPTSKKRDPRRLNMKSVTYRITSRERQMTLVERKKKDQVGNFAWKKAREEVCAKLRSWNCRHLKEGRSFPVEKRRKQRVGAARKALRRSSLPDKCPMPRLEAPANQYREREKAKSRKQTEKRRVGKSQRGFCGKMFPGKP